MRLPLYIAVATSLSACVTQPAVVSSYNGNSVTIQGPGLEQTSVFDDEQALADATCNGQARFASGRKIADGWMEKLFICP